MNDELSDDWMDRAWEQYRAEEDNRLNGHFPWTLVRRVAFSRWRRVVLHLSFWVRKGKHRSRLLGHWHDRLLDALYPDDCVVTFAAPSHRGTK